MKELKVAATLENLTRVQDFVEQELETYGCPVKITMQVSLVVEEIYNNIASYAYNPEIGEATVRCSVSDEPLQVTIQFSDGGKPFNPLVKKDADTSLSAEERDIGGLGILIVKKTMDAVDYAYEDGKNILTIKKTIA